MRIFNQDKTEELFNVDKTLGKLENDTLIIHHNAVQGIEEVGHYVTIAEYLNGGKDVKWVIDTPGVKGQDAYDEEEEILIYIPYTEKELTIINNEKRILDLKRLLSDTDYRAIKYAEGQYTEEEYKPYKELRQSYRDEINRLEEEINA